MLIALNLKTSLVQDPLERMKPLTRDERTCHVLPNGSNPLQEELHLFTDIKQLRIKENKTNVMKSNVELIIDVFHNNLEVIPETKLLGVIVSSDLKWSANTEYICKRANKKMRTYDLGLVILDLEPLEVIRERLCLNFAKKTLKSRYKDIFPENGTQHFTREKPDKVVKQLLRDK